MIGMEMPRQEIAYALCVLKCGAAAPLFNRSVTIVRPVSLRL